MIKPEKPKKGGPAGPHAGEKTGRSVRQPSTAMNHLRDYLDRSVRFTPALFREGDDAMKPVMTWEWQREPTEEEIRFQLDAMRRAGFGTVYILPMPKEFRPDTMVTELEGYLGDAFFAKVKTALDYAAGIGLRLWLYDEGGWPSGAACGRVVQTDPSLRLRRLRRGENGEPEIFTDGGSRPDPYSAAAAACFTRLTHDAYAARLGALSDRVEAMFTDEPAGYPDACGDEVREEVLRRAGYGLPTLLRAVTQPEDCDERELAVRQIYFSVLEEKFRDTMRCWGDACRARGWLFAGHLDRDHTADAGLTKGYGNLLASLKTLQIPGVDAISGQILSERNRMDGNALDFYPRFASSAAAQNGTPLALTESFAVYGCGLGGDEMRYVLNYQAVRGVNLFNFMLFPVTTEQWYAFGERPFFHPAFPGFYALDALCRELERTGLFMATGMHAAETALLYPHADILGAPAQKEAAIAAFRAAGDRLEAADEDFDLIDVPTIRAAAVENGMLRCGGVRYARVVVPEGCRVPRDVDEKLALLRGTPRRFVATERMAFLSRTLRDGADLHICLFNQSRETKTARVTVLAEGDLYRCDPQRGKIYPFENGAPLTLACGQCALLLCAGTPLPAEAVSPPPAAQETVPLTPVEARITAAFSLSRDGAALVPCDMPLPAVGTDAQFPDGFCGEIDYTYRFTAPEEADCAVSLEELRHFAEVFVNGQRAGALYAAPYTLSVDRRLLRQGENVLTLKIANLTAPAYASRDPLAWFEQKYIGPYHKTALALEEGAAGGGFRGLCMTKAAR